MTPSPDTSATPTVSPHTIPHQAAPAAGWLVFRGPVGLHLAELWLPLPLPPELPTAARNHSDHHRPSSGDLQNTHGAHSGDNRLADSEAPHSATPVGNATSVWTGPRLMLQLAQAEPLVGAVEQWLRCPWLLEPSDIQPPDMQPAANVELDFCDAEVQNAALAPLGTRLRLPWPALLSPPPAWLLSPHITWPSVRTELCLDTVPAVDVAGLPDGSLVWLTHSLGTDWPVTVRAAGGRLPARAGLLARPPAVRRGKSLQHACTGLELHATLAEALKVSAADKDADSDADADTGAHSDAAAGQKDDAEIVWHGMPPIGLEQWLGWQARAAAPSGALRMQLPLPVPQGLCLQQGGAVQARGQLIPLAGGYAFRIGHATADAVDPVGCSSSPPLSIESPRAVSTAQPSC